ncbi:MAG TPA: copper chaperone PCu(A)C [Pararhizobium sp.]|nr:copper chaperone PCu(A)C [Pararhizobium sp.]
MAFAALAISPANAAGPGVTIAKPWMRFIIPARPAAGYFTLKNETKEAKVLIGASSPACGMVMLHKSMTEEGSSQMADVGDVTVAPHKSLVFAPGGYHLMCMSPASDMGNRKSVPMTLRFKDGSSVSADFTVRGAAGK